MSESSIAKSLLGELDRTLSPVVQGNINIVDRFIEELRTKLTEFGEALPRSFRKKKKHAEIEVPLSKSSRRKFFWLLEPLCKSSIMHAGSAYEKLAVKEKVDFDIIIVLGDTFVSENFDVERDPVSKFFTMKWKHISPVEHKGRPCNTPHKLFNDKGGYLKTQRLQNYLFQILGDIIDTMCFTDATIQCRKGLVSLDVQIKLQDDRVISIDLAPQIACHSWGQCPDLKPLEDLPVSLRRHIDTLNKNASPVMFFSPCVPTRHQKQRNAHRLCNVSFSQLEKNFMVKNTDTRDMVRLVKFVADRLDWKKMYTFKSFYLKRTAVKYSDELEKRSLWDGYNDLLGFLHKELCSGTIDGFFVTDQETFKGKPMTVEKFQRDIADTQKLNASQVRQLDNKEQ